MRKYIRNGLVFYKTTTTKEIIKLIDLYRGDHSKTIILVAEYTKNKRKVKQDLSNVFFWNVADTYSDKHWNYEHMFYIRNCKTWNRIVASFFNLFLPAFNKKMCQLTDVISKDAFKEVKRSHK